MLNPKKRINGKIYTRSTRSYATRFYATTAALALRNAKYRARVVFEDNHYWIYWRKPK